MANVRSTNPAEGLHDEAPLALGHGDDVEDDAGKELGHPAREVLAPVAPVGQDAGQARERGLEAT